MAYENKALLSAVGTIIKIRAEQEEDKTLCKKIYRDVQRIANAEGVVLGPFEDDDPDSNN